MMRNVSGKRGRGNLAVSTQRPKMAIIEMARNAVGLLSS
jgi:hypothetical protein